MNSNGGMKLESMMEALQQRYRSEVAKAEQTAKALSKDSERKSGDSIREQTLKHESELAERITRRDNDLAEINRWIHEQTSNAEAQQEEATRDARELLDRVRTESGSAYEQIHTGVRRELESIASAVIDLLDQNRKLAQLTNLEWSAMPGASQPDRVPGVVRFSTLRVELRERLDALPDDLRDAIDVANVVDSPALIALPGPGSLVIQHDPTARDQALSVMRQVMTRILASFPGRKARFVICDPIGIGQSFAGFMRLSDLDPSPVGQRIWADPNQIERQLVDLTEHMQTVIQKYLRKDYPTIEAYNEAAGEIAEPYRFVIIPDLPEALSENGASKLKSILESGPRCGVYAILCVEHGAKLPDDLRGSLGDIAATITLGEARHPFAQDPNGEIEMMLDAEPDDALFSQILDRVANASEDAGRIEVPFERLTPSNPDELWSRDCAQELVVPLGRSGARKVQELRLGLGTRQHALIAGRTGSGKSTLLHVMITAAGMWYSPDQLEMYLIDFKKGVEFKAYTGGRLPHVRAVAIESDREFGLSVLQRLDEELTVRGELFRKLGAQDLAGARKLAPDERLPRVLLLIDEFQEFFTIDDEVASDASLLLDRLVRQGRAFGVHVILGSQTLSGAYSLARSTLGQIGVRIALQCSEADSYLILGEDNNAARLLERPGEAIYNNAGGLIEGNSPFQTAWLPDSDRDAALTRLPSPTTALEPQVVFEGNTLANFDETRQAFEHAVPDRSVPRALLGESVAIAPPVAPMFTKRSGGNMLVVGPQAMSAYGMLSSSAITFASTPGSRVVIIDATPEEDPEHARLEQTIAGRADNIELYRAADASRIVADVNEIVRSRSGHPGDPVLFVIVGLHRLRDLRRNEDFGFSLDEDAGSSPDKDLSNILLEGPPLNVWTIAWCDTLTNLERTFDRGTIREFGVRVLMQMSASDSTMLMDSSAASNLGANRALLTDDVEGTEIKFRPVQVPGSG
jgi:S-DNA-T family DNA segregation ATPase FtsK/SpoIIIE